MQTEGEQSDQEEEEENDDAEDKQDDIILVFSLKQPLKFLVHGTCLQAEGEQSDQEEDQEKDNDDAEEKQEDEHMLPPPHCPTQLSKKFCIVHGTCVQTEGEQSNQEEEDNDDTEDKQEDEQDQQDDDDEDKQHQEPEVPQEFMFESEGVILDPRILMFAQVCARLLGPVFAA